MSSVDNKHDLESIKQAERAVLSAIVLCYRAEESIDRVIGPLYKQLEGLDEQFELVLVANYDRDIADTTPKVVKEFSSQRSEVTVVSNSKEGAMGWDMRSGFEAARGEFLIVIDGDEQNPVEDLIKAYKLLRDSGADVVKGRRIARFDGYYRHLVSIVYNALFLILFRTTGLWDINGKPKGLTKSAYESMELKSDDWFADAEIVIEAKRKGLKVVELPVVFRQNQVRSSFVRVSAIFEFLGNMISSFFNRKAR